MLNNDEPNEQDGSSVLLIDADDTLWHSNIYYLESRAAFLDLMSRHRIGASEVEDRIDAAEQALIPDHGYGPKSYRLALLATCREMLRAAPQEAREDALRLTEEIAASVSAHPVELLPGVTATLERLRTRFRLVLVTKGDDLWQRAKLDRAGLTLLFEQVFVLDEKDQKAYEEIVRAVGADVSASWMIGNSPKSDINPATAAGLRGILIPYEFTWSAEDEELERTGMVSVIERFADLPDFFGLRA